MKSTIITIIVDFIYYDFSEYIKFLNKLTINGFNHRNNTFYFFIILVFRYFNILFFITQFTNLYSKPLPLSTRFCHSLSINIIMLAFKMAFQFIIVLFQLTSNATSRI